MDNLETILSRLGNELHRMNATIEEALLCGVPAMNEITRRYLSTKGKQIRPILVFLSAKMFGEVNDHVVCAAAALEMLHNASLIHDDVVDETKLRRSKPTINALWDNRIAVLVGDYFTSNALAVGIRTGNVHVISALSELGAELSLGEMEQIFNVRNRSFDYEHYFSMIRKKTASLFRNCVKMGAETVGATHEQSASLLEYAELLGMCFQIRDDIFDYFDSKEIGKPTGNDLREGKVSLPLLYALNNCSEEEYTRFAGYLDSELLNDATIAEIVKFAKDRGGIEYAYDVMRGMQQEADKIISIYPDSEPKRSLREIFSFIISRNH